MPNQQVTPLVAADAIAGLLRTALAGSKLRLFKADFSPSPASLAADFIGSEANFSGYPTGGASITAWLAPLYDPAGGVSITAPTVQFAVAAATPLVANQLGGWFLLDSTGTLYQYGTFDPQPILAAVGDGLPIGIKIRIPVG